MTRAVWSAIVGFFAVLAVSAVATIVRENRGGAPASAAQPPLVVMEKIDYEPKTLRVTAGTEVTFDNRDVAPHTITADDGSVSSGLVDPGKKFTAVVEESFSYFCELHPSMKARVELSG